MQTHKKHVLFAGLTFVYDPGVSRILAESRKQSQAPLSACKYEEKSQALHKNLCSSSLLSYVYIKALCNVTFQ